MEQFTLLAWLSAVTTSVRLLTSVIVVPHRNPLFMAKSLATTDQLSGGRVHRRMRRRMDARGVRSTEYH